MKRVTSFLCAAAVALLLAAPALASAQDVEIGAISGLNVSTLSTGDEVVDDAIESTVGLRAGAHADVYLDEAGGVRAEVLYSQRGAELVLDEGGQNEPRVTAAFGIDNIEMPVLGFYEVGEPDEGTLRLYAGPTFGLEVNCDLTLESGDQSASSSCEEADAEDLSAFSIASTLGLRGALPVGPGQASLGARYDLGLTDLTGENEGELKHRGVGVTLGYRVPLR